MPLDPDQPDGWLARLIANADVAVVACDPDLARRATRLAKGRPVVRLEPVAPDSGDPPLTPVNPDWPAYLLHTSATTGRPKAVVQSHRNVLARALTYARRVGVGAGDQVSLLARFTFDGGMMDLFGATLSGACLHVIDPLVPAPELRHRLATTGVSLLHCTPTLFRHLVHDVSEVDPSLEGIRTVVLGGEEATGEDLRRFFSSFPANCVLINGLGPTECTLALQYRASRADLGFAALPVGYPVAGVEARMLDEDGQPTELFGELELLGDRVAHGYFRQPDATAAAFGTYPDGTRYYRTGDLVRRRSDGALMFHGRKDRQIKIRGHRVEPGEIEAALRAHPTVAQAAVVLADLSGRSALVGYVTAATAFPPDPAELTGYLGRVLPDYAVPARIVPLASLPVGSTGKLDRSRLPPAHEIPRDCPDAPAGV